MAVPGSGTLSLLGLAREKVHDNYSSGSSISGLIPLKFVTIGGQGGSQQETYEATNTGSASYPDGSAPYNMSGFYSYDHDAFVLAAKSVYTTGVPKKVFACGQTTNGTWYFPDVSPAVNDQVYTASNGTSPPSAGNYGYKNIGSGSTDYRFTVNSSGVVTEVASC